MVNKNNASVSSDNFSTKAVRKAIKHSQDSRSTRTVSTKRGRKSLSKGALPPGAPSGQPQKSFMPAAQKKASVATARTTDRTPGRKSVTKTAATSDINSPNTPSKGPEVVPKKPPILPRSKYMPNSNKSADNPVVPPTPKKKEMSKPGESEDKITPRKSVSGKNDSVQSKRLLETQKNIEETLSKKHYTEEDVDYEQLQARLHAQEEEQCYEWIDKTIERILFITGILCMIASLQTALACYIFVQLPYQTYSSHILLEVFLMKDSLIEANGFSKSFGLQHFTTLPLVILVMFVLILYFTYLVQYVKQERWILYVRHIIFVTLELYLLMSIISYAVDIGQVPSRLDAFFRKDKSGLKTAHGQLEPIDDMAGKFRFLDSSQEYLGCCGYRNRGEWREVFPQKYNHTWPLSCCDEKRSGVACYGPVELTVSYEKRNSEDDKQPDEIKQYTNVPRLYADTCFEKEKVLCVTVISIVSLLTVSFAVLSSWVVILFVQLVYLMHSKNLEFRHKEKYIDFF